MRIFPRSRLVIALMLLTLIGVSVWSWFHWALNALPPMSDTPDDIGNTAIAVLFVLYLAPSVAAALVALAGAALLAALRRPLAGAICGTVALMVVILQAVYFGGANIAGLLVCRDMSRPCSDEWQNIGWAAAGLVLSVYLIIALWKANSTSARVRSAEFR